MPHSLLLFSQPWQSLPQYPQPYKTIALKGHHTSHPKRPAQKKLNIVHLSNMMEFYFILVRVGGGEFGGAAQFYATLD